MQFLQNAAHVGAKKAFGPQVINYAGFRNEAIYQEQGSTRACAQSASRKRTHGIQTCGRSQKRERAKTNE